jgi:SecD/SecF fusion protein
MNGQGAKSLGRINRKSIYSKKISLLFLMIIYLFSRWSFKWPISGGSEISGALITETRFSKCLELVNFQLLLISVRSCRSILGQEAIDNGTNSAIVGLFISLWMMVYYGKAGWYANSLAVNLLFLFGILAER